MAKKLEGLGDKDASDIFWKFIARVTVREPVVLKIHNFYKENRFRGSLP